MNCEALRRAALTDPLRLDAQAQAHLVACGDCAAWYASVRRQEAALYRALSVPLPAELDPPVRSADTPGAAPCTRRRPGLLVAAGFLVLAALALAWPMSRPPLGPGELAEAVATHVVAEPWALAGDEPVSVARLAGSFARAGGNLVSTVRASYAERCLLRGETVGEHIVLEMAEGKVTLVLAPDTPAVRPLRRQENGLYLAVLPAGRGSLVLAADSPGPLGAAEERIRLAVRWEGGV